MKNCFCMSLETAGILIAVFEMVLNIVFFVVFGLVLRPPSKYENPLGPKEFHSKLTNTQLEDEENQTIVGADYYRHSGPPMDMSVLTTDDRIQLFYSVSQTIVAAILLLGITKKSPICLTAWMMYTTINIIIFTCINIWNFSTSDHRSQYWAVKQVSLIISLFFIKVVYDLRKKIKGESSDVAEQVYSL